MNAQSTGNFSPHSHSPRLSAKGTKRLKKSRTRTLSAAITSAGKIVNGHKISDSKGRNGSNMSKLEVNSTTGENKNQVVSVQLRNLASALEGALENTFAIRTEHKS